MSLCALLTGGEIEWNSQADTVYRDAETTAFVCPKWWAAAPAHVLVVPNDHYEDIYAIVDAALASVYRTAKLVAAAMQSTHDCDRTSMRQHNEAGGGQDVSHFHVHEFPRRVGDRLYEGNGETRRTAAEERAPFAERLRTSQASNRSRPADDRRPTRARGRDARPCADLCAPQGGAIRDQRRGRRSGRGQRSCRRHTTIATWRSHRGTRRGPTLGQHEGRAHGEDDPEALRTAGNYARDSAKARTRKIARSMRMAGAQRTERE